MVDHAYPFSVSWTSDGLKDYRKKFSKQGQLADIRNEYSANAAESIDYI